jgi:hypothetical protein
MHADALKLSLSDVSAALSNADKVLLLTYSITFLIAFQNVQNTFIYSRYIRAEIGNFRECIWLILR